MVMNKYLNVLTLILGCTISWIYQTDDQKFITYMNDNKTFIRYDTEIIKDKDFNLQIPEGLQKSKVSINNCFLHILDFKKDQKIIILYIPNSKNLLKEQTLNISFLDFQKLCTKESDLEKIGKIRIIKNRRFGMNKLKKIGLYVIYLNIPANKIGAFNYSIKSIVYQ